MNPVPSLTREVLSSERKRQAASSCLLPAAEGYSRWAPTYDHAPNPLLACEERHLLPLLPDLGNKRVLDLACGTGRWLTKLMARGAESGVGIDCSTAMLQVARRKRAIAHALVGGACEILPFPRAAFDLAICSFALGHIGDLRGTVLELARVTKAGAEVIVSDLHPEGYARGWRVGFRDETISVQIETMPRRAEEIVREFCSNGFECKTCKSLWLGDPEEPLFACAGKSESFMEACRTPAVLICHFHRLNPAFDPRSLR